MSEDELAAAVYTTRRINQSIPLYTGKLSVESSNGVRVSGHGRVFLNWLPQPGVQVRIHSRRPAKKRAPEFLGKDGTLLLSTIETEISMRVLSMTWRTGKIIVEGEIDGTKTSADETLSRVLFHVPNFPPVQSPQMVLQGGGWIVRIDPIQHGSTFYEGLENHRGFGLTHSGSIWRESGQLFSSKDASTILSDVGRFPSFASGRHCNPLLAIGYDSLGAIQWRDWHAARVQAPSRRRHWRPDHFAASTFLAQVFSGMLALLHERYWAKFVDRALEWYLDAASPEIRPDASIVMSQAALETLASAKLQRDHFQSPQGLANLPTGDRLALFLSILEIPLDAAALGQSPHDLARVLTLMKKQKLDSAVRVIVEVRNAAVHAADRRGILTDPLVAVSVRELSLWYLELALLRLCGYADVHSNRTRFGIVEPVPWASYG